MDCLLDAFYADIFESEDEINAHRTEMFNLRGKYKHLEFFDKIKICNPILFLTEVL